MMDALPPIQGALVSSAGVHYRLWAPVVHSAAVLVEPGDRTEKRSLRLTPSGDGFFHGCDAMGRAGDRYRFILGDRMEPLPDPASRWQPEGVHGPSMVIDPNSYSWRDTAWHRPAFRDLVIYELHVGTFTPAGTFTAVIEKLPLLRDTGINAIEIMPIADFAGSRNWGYDGVLWYAPSRAYGTPDDLRELVDAAHRLGLAVILDVVYNHFGPDGNYLREFIGDYLNEEQKTPWGGAIRYSDPRFAPLRELAVANPTYWMREFHVDGFRFDATHHVYDDGPCHMLAEMTDAIHARGGYAIAEDPRNDARLITPTVQGGLGFDGVWADDFHHVIRVASTREAEGYFADYSGKLAEAIESLRHGWLFRGQVSAVTGEARGTECDHITPASFVHCVANHDQTGNHAFGERSAARMVPAAQRAADALLCLSPYTPMIFMGQEWAASTPFRFFTDHNADLGKLIVRGRREEFRDFAAFQDEAALARIPDPQAPETFTASKLIWGEREQGAHRGTLALFRACLQLRAAEAAFRPLGRDRWSVRKLAMGIGLIELEGDSGVWWVLFDLWGGHRGSLQDVEAWTSNPQGGWSCLLSSNAAEFGGSGRQSLDLATGAVTFDEPETLVLHRSTA